MFQILMMFFNFSRRLNKNKDSTNTIATPVDPQVQEEDSTEIQSGGSKRNGSQEDTPVVQAKFLIFELENTHENSWE